MTITIVRNMAELRAALEDELARHISIEADIVLDNLGSLVLNRPLPVTIQGNGFTLSTNTTLPIPIDAVFKIASDGNVIDSVVIDGGSGFSPARNNYRVGIRLYSSDGRLKTASDNVIRNCVIKNCNSHGIELNGAPFDGMTAPHAESLCQSNKIFDNVIERCDGVGVAQFYSWRNSIRGNTIRKSGNEAVTIDVRSHFNRVSDNIFQGNVFHGGVGEIGIDYSDSNIISGNQFYVSESGHILPAITLQNNCGSSNFNVISFNSIVISRGSRIPPESLRYAYTGVLFKQKPQKEVDSCVGYWDPSEDAASHQNVLSGNVIRIQSGSTPAPGLPLVEFEPQCDDNIVQGNQAWYGISESLRGGLNTFQNAARNTLSEGNTWDWSGNNVLDDTSGAIRTTPPCFLSFSAMSGLLPWFKLPTQGLISEYKNYFLGQPEPPSIGKPLEGAYCLTTTPEAPCSFGDGASNIIDCFGDTPKGALVTSCSYEEPGFTEGIPSGSPGVFFNATVYGAVTSFFPTVAKNIAKHRNVSANTQSQINALAYLGVLSAYAYFTDNWWQVGMSFASHNIIYSASKVVSLPCPAIIVSTIVGLLSNYSYADSFEALLYSTAQNIVGGVVGSAIGLFSASLTAHCLQAQPMRQAPQIQSGF